ncbi:MAG: hypothetical protein LKF23_02705 [Levilactobacillus sp.]|jgi:hypothetical protein|uniref:hypothetical protein n=1 Tax=Levilactobacillus sp. TaxID=2767919 RepID=UPI0025905E36|nr:hypothetical protein [Levilactobacillus sp.]MCH4123556.1 hypothetical protein [Levilactobacillus sp.]
MKYKGNYILALTMALFVAGCSSESKPTVASSSSDKPVQSVKTSSVKKALPVGEIISSKPNDPNIAYKMANKRVKVYRSLREFGTKGGVYADYFSVEGGTLGVDRVVTTTKGVYYHVVQYTVSEAHGFEGKKKPDSLGYVGGQALRPFKTIKSEWTYAHRKPYYVADPNSHRIWNRPAYTEAYTYITHVFDRLTTQQLYATKELITHKNLHYVYLETAKGRKLGWVYKARHTLIAGKYRDPGKQLLKLRKHEHLVTKVQSKKSTKNRVGVNDSLSLQQRAYLVKNRKNQIVRVLIISMDNRPTKIYFRNRRSVKVKTYKYRRTPWKSTTNKKKLRTKYLVQHEYDYASVDGTQNRFYSIKNKRLVRLETLGFDGGGYVDVYRNGHVKFFTDVDEESITYSINDYK